MRARWIVLALCCCLVAALLALRPAGVAAQQTGGSFGGSRWGSGGGSTAPTKTWGQKTGGVSRPPSWGSSYDPNANRRPRYGNNNGGECAASLSMITLGLVGGLVVGRRGRRKRR
jgi:hypothetical protein